MHSLVELDENQLRQLVDAQSLWRAYTSARAEAQQVRGSMFWREAAGTRYLIRASTAGAQKSLGPETDETRAIFARFQERKQATTARLAALKARMEEQRRLNRAYRVGRAPAIVVRVLNALDQAGIGDQFVVIGTHALYAYEMAAGVRVASDATATRDLDLLFDARKRLAFASALARMDASLIATLRKADPTFRIMRGQLQTAVNDEAFEVDIIRRAAQDGDPHPMRMSEVEDDLWAVQVPDGERMASGPHFEQLVVAATGEMAMMRTLHPSAFVRVKQSLARSTTRDVQKARKDALQAQVAQHLWDTYLRLREPSPQAALR